MTTFVRIAGLAVVLVLAVVPALALEPVDDLVPVEYLRTIDADTIVVSVPEAMLAFHPGPDLHVRLIAIDGPELRDGTVAAFESALFAARRMETAQAVYLEYDAGAGRDAFGRMLAWAWYLAPEEDTPRLLNLELVQSGHAWLYAGETSTRYQDELEDIPCNH